MRKGEVTVSWLTSLTLVFYVYLIQKWKKYNVYMFDWFRSKGSGETTDSHKFYSNCVSGISNSACNAEIDKQMNGDWEQRYNNVLNHSGLKGSPCQAASRFPLREPVCAGQGPSILFVALTVALIDPISIHYRDICKMSTNKQAFPVPACATWWEKVGKATKHDGTELNNLNKLI